MEGITSNQERYFFKSVKKSFNPMGPSPRGDSTTLRGGADSVTMHRMAKTKDRRETVSLSIAWDINFETLKKKKI